MTWNNSNMIAALVEIDRDRGFEANTITCPVCKKKTLAYDRTSIIDMTVWCSTCGAGLRQGNGSSNEGKVKP